MGKEIEVRDGSGCARSATFVWIFAVVVVASASVDAPTCSNHFLPFDTPLAVVVVVIVSVFVVVVVIAVFVLLLMLLLLILLLFLCL